MAKHSRQLQHLKLSMALLLALGCSAALAQTRQENVHCTAQRCLA